MKKKVLTNSTWSIETLNFVKLKEDLYSFWSGYGVIGTFLIFLLNLSDIFFAIQAERACTWSNDWLLHQGGSLCLNMLLILLYQLDLQDQQTIWVEFSLRIKLSVIVSKRFDTVRWGACFIRNVAWEFIFLNEISGTVKMLLPP